MGTQGKSWVGNSLFFLFYLLIIAVFISLGPMIFSSKWVSSSDFHACIEISSSFIALIAAISALVYFFLKNNKYFLIIALGFFICGSEDFAHGIFELKHLFAQSDVGFSKFIQGTYITGRTSLAIMVIAAVLFEKKFNKIKNTKPEVLLFFILAVLFWGSVTILASNLPFSLFIFSDNLISRPVDFISALLFSIAFFLVFKRFLKHGDTFSGMLGACILLNVIGQIYMSFSKQRFDVFFDVAHWANILSYCMPVLGISIESFNEITNIKKAEQDLKDEQWTKQGLAEFNIKMQGEKDLPVLCSNIVTFLAEYMDAKTGACFLMQKDNKLKLFSSYAYTRQKHIFDEFILGQGIIGQAALEKQIITLTDVPKDYITISSGPGEILPKTIIIIPFEFHEELIGVLEFGFLNEIGEMNMDFVKKASDLVAVTINSAQNQYQIKKMLKKSQAQTEALRVREEELEQAHEILEEKAKDHEITSKYKSEFLANMSHELRTPLNSILLLSKHLSENKKNNLSKKETEFADTVYHSGQDLLELINDILDLSKVEAGKLIMNVEDIALKSIGANLKTKFVPVAKDKKISFKLKYAKDLPESILTDSQRLEQILKNFLSNAIKFTDKGSVTLEINHPDSEVVFSNNDLDPKECIAFSVIDTGVGIEPSKQTIVFEAFQQGDGSTSRKYGGTGLGLSISRSIAKALGGEIQLFSTKGDGSKFVLYLPFVFRELKPIEFVESVENNNEQNTGNRVEIEISKLIKSNENDYVEDDISVNKQKILRKIHDKETVFKGKKVLLVDDDMRNIYTLKNILEDKGITIIVAKNGKESLERLADDADVNLVLMDIIMPEMDGFEATARIRAQKKFKDLPVIALTAKAMKGDRNKCIEAGANDYLSKPVDMDKLFSMLRVWLY